MLHIYKPGKIHLTHTGEMFVIINRVLTYDPDFILEGSELILYNFKEGDLVTVTE